MKNASIEDQTKMYMYDLMNTAKEHRFKGEDRWELSMATDTEMRKIQMDYYPTLATKVIPEFLLQVFNLTKLRLDPLLNKTEGNQKDRSVANSELNYIVAYNPKRPRT